MLDVAVFLHRLEKFLIIFYMCDMNLCSFENQWNLQKLLG